MGIRLYEVFVRNEKTDKVTVMTATPVNHEAGCTILSKITNYPWRTKGLREVYQ